MSGFFLTNLTNFSLDFGYPGVLLKYSDLIFGPGESKGRWKSSLPLEDFFSAEEECFVLSMVEKINKINVTTQRELLCIVVCKS